MKTISIYFVILFFCFSSCVKNNISENKNSDNVSKEELVSRMQTSQEYSVPVKEGYITQVIYNGEVIATAVEKMTILLPITASITKTVDDLTLVYIPKAEYPNILENDASIFQVVCFEDSKEADYDYNDLVIHVYYRTKGDIFAFGVQPIALGSTKSIKLGCVV